MAYTGIVRMSGEDSCTQAKEALDKQIYITQSGKNLSFAVEVCDVPMGYVSSVGFIATLALVHALEDLGKKQVHIFWPYTVLVEDKVFAKLSISAAYKTGVVAIVSLELMEAVEDKTLIAICNTIAEELSLWNEQVENKVIKAGPVSGCLSEIFDYTLLLGEEVLLETAEGRAVGVGTFGGLDVWGRACIIGADGKETDYSWEQVRMKSLSDYLG